MRAYKFRKGVMILLFVVGGILLFSLVVMLLWNAILPAVLNVSAITYVQALGILVLSKILFGGFRGGGWHKGHHWRSQMQEKWATMTPEEKDKFRQEWKNRCGPWKKWDDDMPSKPAEQSTQQ